jgi:hypothetical protein
MARCAACGLVYPRARLIHECQEEYVWICLGLRSPKTLEHMESGRLIADHDFMNDISRI